MDLRGKVKFLTGGDCYLRMTRARDSPVYLTMDWRLIW